MPTGRVAVDGTALLLGGEPWFAVGLNAYQLGTDWTVNIGCGAQVDLDAYFAALPSGAVTRFNAFQSLATDKVTGELDFAPLDSVFATAERYGELVIPVLTGQEGACEDEHFKTRDWYAEGWKATPAQGLSYADWLHTALQRWSGSPAVAAWELIGEPEASVCPGGNCSLATRTCPSDAADVVRRFVDDAGAIARGVTDRLLTVGFAGGSQCGTVGDDFVHVAESPGVDVLQYHDYNHDGEAVPGSPDGLAQRLDQAAAVGKPLLVGEIGQYGGSCADLDQRAEALRTRITEQRDAGTAGALVWAFVPDPRLDECTYDVGPDDPVFAMLATFTGS